MKNTFKIPGIILIILSIIIIHSCKKEKSALPVLTTAAVTDITPTSAVTGGNITSDGGDSVTARGVCWNTTTDAVTAGNHTADGSSTGSFISSLTELTGGTLYYVRAYATNSAGTSYGNELTFTTPPSGPTVTDVDLNVYNTIIIGTQTWLVQNLQSTKYNDNTPIPLVTDNSAWGALSTPGYCWYYNDKTSFKTTYGALYNWFALNPQINGGKNVCPTGWHVPSDAEWTTLTTYLGGEMHAGGQLKEEGVINWSDPNLEATNVTGFTATPGGSRDLSGSYIGKGTYGIWWSATEDDATYSLRRYMSSYDGSVDRGDGYKQGGFSVRCLQD